MKVSALTLIICISLAVAIQFAPGQDIDNQNVLDAQQLPGREPAPGEQLEDEPAANLGAQGIDQQQPLPGPEPRPGEVFEDESVGKQSIGEDDQCVLCPLFLRNCQCRSFIDCRYIRRTCFSCPRWRCVKRGKFDGPFDGRGQFDDGRGQFDDGRGRFDDDNDRRQSDDRRDFSKKH